MTDERYEVVIRPTDGFVEEHARLVKKELVDQQWLEDVIVVRRIGGTDE